MPEVIAKSEWMTLHKRPRYDYPWDEWLDGNARRISIKDDLHPNHQDDPHRFRVLVYARSTQAGTPYCVSYHADDGFLTIFPRRYRHGR